MGEAPFTPGRDSLSDALRPITRTMESAVEHPPADTRDRDLHVLRDCLALGKPGKRRAPAKVRLVAALGPELAAKLLRSLESREPR
jgi:hypothetical protein